MGDLSGINHVTFLTGDMDRLVAFYEDVFDARKLMELPTRDGDGRHALIDVGGGATLHPFQLPQSVPPPKPMSRAAGSTTSRSMRRTPRPSTPCAHVCSNGV